jgi:NADH-quinone oxidoreductase subunit I
MKQALKEIFTGFYSLLVGLWITLRQFFRPTVTVHYPRQTLKIPPRFRGHIELVRNPATGQPICFACKLCERACPSDCITVEGAKVQGARKRSVTAYKLDFTRCSLCGSCVEACREGAIRFSREYNLAGWTKEEFVLDLFKRLEAEARGTVSAQAPKPGAAMVKSDAAPQPPAEPAHPGKPKAATELATADKKGGGDA